MVQSFIFQMLKRASRQSRKMLHGEILGPIPVYNGNHVMNKRVISS